MAIYGGAAPSLAGSVIMLTTLALLTYGLRIYCRVTRKSWSVEDWIMTAALVPFAVLVAGCLGGAFNGIGIRDSRLAEPQNVKYQAEGQKFFLIFEVGYCSAIIPIKLSISWMLIRVAEGRKAYLYAQYVVIVVFVLMNIIALIFILINCIPVDAAWNTELLKQGGHCQPSYVLADVYYACTAVNILTDWVTALMPVPLLWNVQLNRNTKISIVGLMGLGIFASMSACVRLKYTVALTSQSNYLYSVTNVVIWGFTENALGMIVGNVATLRPLFRILRDRKTSSNNKYNSRGYYSSQRTGPANMYSRNYELAEQGKHTNQITTTSMADHTRRPSQMSDGDSQKQILAGGTPPGDTDILVSRQVIVAYD
ncbi:hypothetical protein AnigIFM59636_003850 [Aspergillus niger]|uniref:Rhodopsin domain-containing protein n=1 Tax=Aspergillus niger ATCC 13496 TaxID=1353008 RepID=A0A370CEY4_ASPNG|nr:hypothetical protein M747DRAFT_367075 [Aspergillus niger ATCC 13496]GKZ87426.1 hypothetical protein AnigIFM59636_003850 [Aspergillus niger]|eukprot:XP_001398617.2 hypothetical protein ANI_1_188164 [Aspergillus niger CBS 513.88]